MPFALIFIIGIACMAGALALVTGFERRRARLLKEAGVALGLRPFEEGERLAVPSVEIMRKRGRTIGAVLEGVWQGESITVFDLSYPAGKSVSRTTVLVLRLPTPRIPEFAAIRRNMWLNTPTVDLPPAEALTALKRHWLLYAPEWRWPFDGQVTAWLERQSQWSFEGRGSGLFVYRRARRAPIKALSEWLGESLTEAKGFLSGVPTDRLEPTIDDDAASTVYRRSFSFKVSLRI